MGGALVTAMHNNVLRPLSQYGGYDLFCLEHGAVRLADGSIVPGHTPDMRKLPGFPSVCERKVGSYAKSAALEHCKSFATSPTNLAYSGTQTISGPKCCDCDGEPEGQCYLYPLCEVDQTSNSTLRLHIPDGSGAKPSPAAV